MNNIFIWLQILFYVIFKTEKNDVILVYHSLFFVKPITILRKIFKREFILQIEEYYAATNKESKDYFREEQEFIKLARSYIVVNDIIKEELQKLGKEIVIAYGDYRTPKKYEIEITNKISLIYAGVIEYKRNAASIAAQSMLYLNKNYELNILGFGETDDIKKLNKEISDINNRLGYDAIKLHGRLSGDDYFKFLQNSDIGLSTHTYSPENLISAKYSFPSKVLSYLSNDLRVVAQRLNCLECSKFGTVLFLYDNPTAENVAKAIETINTDEEYSSRNLIKKLDKKFIRELSILLKNKISFNSIK